VDETVLSSWFDALAGFHGRGSVVLEARGADGGIEHRLGLPQSRSQLIVRSAQAAMPGLRLDPVETTVPLPGLRAWQVRFTTHRRALRSDDSATVARGILGVLGNLQKGELLVMQWSLGTRLGAVAIPNKFEDFTHDSYWKTLVSAPLAAPGPVDPEFRNALRDKQSTVGWRACLRIGVRAGTAKREHQLIYHLVGALRVAESPGVRLRIAPIRSRRLREAADPWRWPVVINRKEIVGLSGWPVGEQAGARVERSGHRPLPPHRSIPSEGRVVVDSSYPGTTRPLALNPPSALQHLHVLGPTGVGKSTLLLNLICQDMDDGRAVVVIEPKGDLIADVLARVPKERLDDVVLLDPADDAPVGLNALATRSNSSDLVADQLLAVFRGLYHQYFGPRTQDVLHACLLTLAKTPGMTLTALPLLLSNPGFRRSIIGSLDDPIGLGSFWSWYEGISEAERQQAIAPVMNKLRAFLLRPALRGVIGQAQPKFDIRQVFTQRRILLVDLSKGSLGSETAALLGSLVIAQLWQTAQGRSAIPTYKRHPVFLYVDEFQDYLNLPTDLSDVLTQARGLGLGLVMAHQHLGQLPPAMKSAVLANARSRVCFQLGQDDAAVMARGERLLTPEDFRELGAYETYVHLMADGQNTAWASGTTRKPMAPLQSGNALRRASRKRWGVPKSETEAAIRALAEENSKLNVQTALGRRRRWPELGAGGAS